MNEFCITVTTYKSRFFVFQRTLKTLREQTQADIFVSVNAMHDKPYLDEGFRRDMLTECLKYPSVYPSFYGKFRGLAKIWNDQVAHCGYKDVIMTNDDVTILPGFIDEFVNAYFSQNPRRGLRTCGTWSTLFINKDYLDQCGWFNEQYFLGIGVEDCEFTRRTGSDFPSFVTDKWINTVDWGEMGKEQRAAIDFATASTLACKTYHSFNNEQYHRGSGRHTKTFRPFEKYYEDMYDVFWVNGTSKT